MRIQPVSVDDIQIGERHRALSDEAAQKLAASMESIGLRHPISIRIVDEMEIDGEIISGVPLLVAGRHRLAAAKILGWSHIDCVEVDDDAIAAELWEIAENLHRLDLTKEQRDQHIRRYAELLEARRETNERQVTQTAAPVLSDGRRKGPQHDKGIPRQIAEETGLSVDTVRRALNPPPVATVVVKSDQDVILSQANAIVAAWNRACPEARDIALQQIDGPVFDKARAA